MTLSDLSKKSKDAAKVVKETADPRTTGKFWSNVRNVSGWISSVLWFVAEINVLPPVYDLITTGLAVGTSALSLGANMDKSGAKDLIKNNKYNVAQVLKSLFTLKK